MKKNYFLNFFLLIVRYLMWRWQCQRSEQGFSFLSPPPPLLACGPQLDARCQQWQKCGSQKWQVVPFWALKFEIVGGKQWDKKKELEQFSPFLGGIMFFPSLSVVLLDGRVIKISSKCLCKDKESIISLCVRQ